MWEEVVLNFCFLQADDIGLEDCCDASEEGESQADGVDVPGSDAEGRGHGEKIRTRVDNASTTACVARVGVWGGFAPPQKPAASGRVSAFYARAKRSA